MAQQPSGFEYKHVECPQIPAWVDAVTNDYSKFYWELTATQTVVSRDSHLESGLFDSDNLYSVTTTERFVAIDFQRARDTANLQRIKEVERDYFQISASLANLGASPLNNYSTPPSKSVNWIGVGCLAVFYIVPGIIYYWWQGKKHEKVIIQWTDTKARLDRLIRENRSILNIAT